MFTGLVQSLGTVRAVDADQAAGLKLSILADWNAVLNLGESIAVNGCCLTLVHGFAEEIGFDVGPETIAKTDLGRLRAGDRVNLERAMQLSDRLGGHLVTGHIDGLGSIASRETSGEWQTVWFQAPAELTRLMVPKGCIAVDGVSLTLCDVLRERFSVMLIPHTLSVTTLGHKPIGAPVNLETDIIGKYVAQWLSPYQ